ncbi:hypothetical protein AMAG_15545 [Allomyces macrogynus ATCC 38327]|uniref:Uncharacterized protein n=1 Tax=Allomyces macrogynus (strain ATCC 38327) TaxID=578462 RepID=A0A0L0T9B1_ALLM3|nr:hypothetical protein AMAG_15545 [Allomyces macrogynus ATCC 38327]|eukprot:KNE71306.1 hypothetical protein AMAG_15545 [Allomyces macrogynus ATCC 38327]
MLIKTRSRRANRANRAARQLLAQKAHQIIGALQPTFAPTMTDQQQPASPQHELANDDPHPLPSDARREPKSGIAVTLAQAQHLLAHLGAVTSLTPSSKGYNNCLYLATITSPSGTTTTAVVKAGGWCWSRVKTEAEVAGLAIVGAAVPVPVPRVLAWRSMGHPELVAIERMPGVALADVWANLAPVHRRDAVVQVAKMVGMAKTGEAAQGLVKKRVVGNLSVRHGPVTHAAGPPSVEDVTVGPMVDGGLGPWADSEGMPAAMQYLAATTRAAVATLRSPALDVLKSMRDRFAARIDAYVAALDGDVAAPGSKLPTSAEKWAAVPLELVHGDLTLKNVLVTVPGADLAMRVDDPLTLSATTDLALDQGVHVSALIDLEWSGVFPWADEHRVSYEFVKPEEIADVFGLDESEDARGLRNDLGADAVARQKDDLA